jgi:hypothetical protein
MATESFKIAPLVDVDDVVTAKPDEKCIMTYVSEFAYMFEIMGRTKQQDVLSEREQVWHCVHCSRAFFFCLLYALAPRTRVFSACSTFLSRACALFVALQLASVALGCPS